MPELPDLNAEQVAALIPSATDIRRLSSGGQKLVFKGTIDRQEFALKFIRVPQNEFFEDEDFSATETAQRAKREVETMRECDSPHMVRPGPIGISFTTLGDQQLVYFSEEFIQGKDLQQIYKDRIEFSPPEIAKIGLQIGQAIKSIWSIRKVHRDIKPANIMRRDASGDYVLLDAGLAFDIDGQSLSRGPVGTPYFFAPEQFEFNRRRSALDFRTDLFALGVTLYYLASRRHPFAEPGEDSQTVYMKIINHNPTRIQQFIPEFPAGLDTVISRLLGKSPHLRYRTCDQFIAAIRGL